MRAAAVHGAGEDVQNSSGRRLGIYRGLTSDESPIGEIILSRALDRDVDLIVIGAYSHARWAEIIFGGVTRTLLTQMPVPVLVSQ